MRIDERSFPPVFITHLFPMHPFPAPENIRKPYNFLMFSGD